MYLNISGAIGIEMVLSVADYQGQTRQGVVLACEYSGSGFIWLSHVIWDREVKDCSLKQHTPPRAFSLVSHSGLHYRVCICVAFYWINIWPNLYLTRSLSDLCGVNESSRIVVFTSPALKKKVAWNPAKWSHLGRKEGKNEIERMDLKWGTHFQLHCSQGCGRGEWE